MSFLYPCTITVSRPAAQTGAGKLGYGGRVATEDVPVVTGVRCGIQKRRDGQKGPVGLPGDGTKATWFIFIPLEANVAPGTIKDRDMVTDNLGRHFQVTVDYWDSLGWNLTVEKMEA